MAVVKAFKALSSNPLWFSQLLCHPGTGLSEFKGKLEGRGEQGIGTGSIDVVEDEIAGLLKKGHLEPQEQEAIYIYEQETALGKQYGVWLMTAVQDFIDGMILRHEETLSDREARLANYRDRVGLEGSPVLLTYRPDPKIDQMVFEITTRPHFLKCKAECTFHRIWKVDNPEEINALIGLFERVQKVYIGDGHHRLAAAAKSQQSSPQYVMALYAATHQIRISSFNRLVVSEVKTDLKEFMKELGKLFFISEIPGNTPFNSDRLHRFGMLFGLKWYQLDLKPELTSLSQLPDVCILQDRVLSPLFGIDDPKRDPALFSYPVTAFGELLDFTALKPDSIAFTIYPMSVHKLLEVSDKQLMLPPKSSFIEPKIPYGLLLNAQTLLARSKGKVF